MNTIVTSESKSSDIQSFHSASGWELAQRMANALSKASLVPKMYQGNIANCLIALEMAQRLGASPLLIMQNLYVVHGNPSWSAKFLIATFNQCGRFTAIKYRFTGEQGKDSWGCIAYAKEKSTGELIESAEVTIALAKKEGWYSKTGSKWQTMPQQMLMYRSAAWMVNTHAPELSMGIRTTDELEDIDEPVMTVTEAGRNPESLVSLEQELLGDIEQQGDGVSHQHVLDAIASAQDADELNQAWELLDPSEAPPEHVVAAYTAKAETLK